MRIVKIRNMKILAIDPGLKRIGMAACDPLGITTRLLPVLKVSKPESAVQNIIQLVTEEGFQKILVGLPLNMDGTEGEGAKRARSFSEKLKKNLEEKNLPCAVELQDERLTSYEAEERLKEKKYPKEKWKEFLDSVAAEIILEDYLHTHKI